MADHEAGTAGGAQPPGGAAAGGAETHAGYAVEHGTHPELPDFATVSLSGPDGLVATFVPGAGMVGCSLTDRGEELLGMRGGLAAYVERGSSFGIPLLAPWANRLGGLHYEVDGVSVDLDPEGPGVRIDAGTGLPIHGLYTASPDWTLTTTDTGDDWAGLRAALVHDDASPSFAAFPFPHRLEVSAVLQGRELTITTTQESIGDRAVPVAFGWHPYLAPPGAARGDWVLDLPFTDRVETGPGLMPTGVVLAERAPRGPLGTDTHETLYARVPPGAVAAVIAGGRRLEVRLVDGYPYALLWAPASPEVVCIEPMTAPIDPFSGRFPLRSIAPGESFTATFTIAVLPA